MARVVDSVHGSEMRVGMHTEEFGNISVSTAVNRQQIAAQISFDHGDLARLMAAHLPGMQEKLGSETGLHATVEVINRGSSFAGGQSGSDPGAGSGQAGGQGHHSAPQQARSANPGYGAEAAGRDRSPLHASAASAPQTATERLDIRV